MQNLTKIKQQRILKICPHNWLSEYDISIWIDGNIELKCDITKDFLPHIDLESFDVWTKRHPSRDCTYDEARAVVNLGKALKNVVETQMQRYRKLGFPKHHGLCETNIIVRRHNQFTCKRLMLDWAKEVLLGCHRDQLSFNYCLWRTNTKIGYIDDRLWSGVDNVYFGFQGHGHLVREEDVVNVVFLTHDRTEVARECLRCLIKNLKYKKLRWIISDDMSHQGHVERLKQVLDECNVQDYVFLNTTEYGNGLGASMNNGLREAFCTSDLVLTVEDDWMLQKKLDISKMVKLIRQNNVSMIRLGTLMNAKPVDSEYHGYYKVMPDL